MINFHQLDTMLQRDFTKQNSSMLTTAIQWTEHTLKNPATNAAPHLSRCIPAIAPPCLISAPPVSYVIPCKTISLRFINNYQYINAYWTIVTSMYLYIMNHSQVSCRTISIWTHNCFTQFPVHISIRRHRKKSTFNAVYLLVENSTAHWKSHCPQTVTNESSTQRRDVIMSPTKGDPWWK